MPLTPGTRLGPYEIVGPIGAGGMGEVYQARDTRLERTVALKVLPPAFAADTDRRQRFEREARLVASLSHPHICVLHDVGTAPAADHNPATTYLVMEYLDGETLAARLARGPLPLGDVIRHGRDIAFALDAAHRQRIVHRDLKPANIMLTRSGVKLLDFGLAKAAEPALDSSLASTIEVTAVTSPGTVLGTVPYMAPEQIEGRAADARSDIFALGSVIYEMVSGRRAFSGESPASVASAILTTEPPPLAGSPSLDRIVRSCLAKDPDRRWQSAHDIGLQLTTIAEPAERTDESRKSRWLPWVVAATATLLALVAGATAWRARTAMSIGESTAVDRPVTFAVAPPPGRSFAVSVESTSMSMSPDGSHLAFIAVDAAGTTSVWIRALASGEAVPLAGTAGALSAFWAPDGRAIGYFAEGKLKRVAVAGGAPVTICDVRESIGQTGTWGVGDQILFASVQGEAIMRVPSAGGTAVELLKPDPAGNQRRTTWPSFLPDGRQFLYLAGLADDSGAVMLGDLGGSSREVMRVKSIAQYVEPGFIVFMQESKLVARRFDVTTGTVSGDPLVIAERVNGFLATGMAQFAASPNGVIAFQPHGNLSRIASFDRRGREVVQLRPPGHYLSVRVSADGGQLLFDRADDRTTQFDIWLLDTNRGAETKLTHHTGGEVYPLWGPKDTIIYSAQRGGAPQLFLHSLRSAVPEALGTTRLAMQIPADLSPDGTSLLFSERAPRGTYDLLTITLADRKPVPFRASAADETDGRFSPDGDFLVYASNESGKSEVYVEPFPSRGSRQIVSAGGGRLPRWSRDGRELYYIDGDGSVTAAPVRLSSPSVEIGRAAKLFPSATAWPWLNYDVTAAGRFIAVERLQVAAELPLTVIVNWPATVR